ncbi:DUF11 domain-containing protein [Microcoleus sp. FACHB-672]|uniref:DUF11 domain-containing protein n=1 Tax=Microcoleus sp. FACHB-672 TaxID=2692825 RepID=UPI00168210D2|nr:DUF11 domain-containing protein [Microcoleus sp. FACHB-672]MBD2043134.1 DUF11 domain-containing protein [Microcoleus sp. FACHB-672]
MQNLLLLAPLTLTLLTNPKLTLLNAQQTHPNPHLLKNKRLKPQKLTQQNIPLLTQTPAKPVQLRLQAERQVVSKDENGKENRTWQTLSANAVVQPGDIIRYTLRGENSTASLVNNFVVTQPIPKQTVYVLNSTTGTDAKITYSIDNAKTYLANPTIQKTLPDGKIETKPAPAEAYTHIRWEFTKPVNPAEIEATYQIKVK